MFHMLVAPDESKENKNVNLGQQNCENPLVNIQKANWKIAHL